MSDNQTGQPNRGSGALWSVEGTTAAMGRLLLHAAAVENELDTAITCYLGADDERWDFVRHDLLGGMTLGGKSELLRRILGHTGLAAEFPALKPRLEEFVLIRNVCAHWRVQPNIAFDPADPTSHRLSFTTLAKRGGKTRDEVRLFPHRFSWLVNVLTDDLYAVQRRLDRRWEPVLANYEETWVPDTQHDHTDEGPPTDDVQGQDASHDI